MTNPYGMQGPFYPTQGFAAFRYAPVSTMPLLTTLGAASTAFRVGYGIGGALDRRFGFSDNIANTAFNRMGPAPNWMINSMDRMGIGTRWFK